MHEIYHVTFFTKAGISVKARKFFGVLFTIIGAMTAFISVAVLILPLVANDQTRLVLESFHQPSNNPLVNAMNRCITFMMENGTLTLAMGAGVLLTGILLLLSAARLEEEQAAKRRSAQRKTPPSAQPAPVWKTRPSGEAVSQNPFANPVTEQVPQTKPTVSPAPDRTQELETLPPAQPASPAPLSPTSPLASKGLPQDNSSYQRPPEPDISMPPDDQVTSFGSARRIAPAPAAEEESAPAVAAEAKPAPAPQPQPKPAVTPIFSTGFHLPDKPVAAPAEAKSEPVPAPEAKIPEAVPSAQSVIPDVPAAPKAPAPVSEAAPRKSKVVIKSTMGRHSV